MQPKPQPANILFLEDDDVDRQAFLRMVRENLLPYQITVATTLAEGRDHLARSKFDLIIADYHLPDGHSTELFEEVRDTPFILLTGTLEESLALRTLERGADDYFPKTPDQQHLKALPFTIEKTLHRKSIRERERRLTRQLLESEERFRLLVESVHDYAIYMIDREGLITTWNLGAERIKGWKAEEILGRNYSALFTPEDAAAGKPQREMEVAAREGQYQGHGRRMRKDGSIFWADVTLTAIRDDAGKLIGFGKIIRDITERQRAEEALRESEANLQLALNAAQFGMWKWDLFAEEMTWSDAGKALLGLPLDTPMTYTRFLQALDSNDRARVDEALGQALELRTACNAEMRTLWPDGSLHLLRMIGRGFYDQNGKAVRMAGVAFERVGPG